jgi:outer membrane lipoprotein SlyB
MSAKHAASFGAAFGGACGGVLASGLVQYLCGDGHYLPLIVGTLAGAVIAGITTALVTRGNLEPTPKCARDE